MSVLFKLLLLSILSALLSSCYLTVPFDGLSKNRIAPSLEVETWLNSEIPIEIENLEGSHSLIEFWSKDCPPCVRSINKMKELDNGYGEKLNVISVHVNLKKGAPQAVQEIVEFSNKLRIEYPIGIDQKGQQWERYHFGALPHGVILNKRGKVIWSGNLLVWDIDKALLKILGQPAQDTKVVRSDFEIQLIEEADSNCKGGVCKVKVN